MLKNIVLSLLIVSPTLSYAETPELLFRELVRARVVNCYAEGVQAPVTITITPPVLDGEIVDPTIYTENNYPVDPEVICEVKDSYVDDLQIETGTLQMWREGENPITELLYSVILRDGRRIYGISDFAKVLDYSSNGARYTMQSYLTYMDDGSPWNYPIFFWKNSASRTMAEVIMWDNESESEFVEEHIINHVDPATTIMIKRVVDNAILFFTLDFRTVN
jgi:hypothetical protein